MNLRKDHYRSFHPALVRTCGRLRESFTGSRGAQRLPWVVSFVARPNLCPRSARWLRGLGLIGAQALLEASSPLAACTALCFLESAGVCPTEASSLKASRSRLVTTQLLSMDILALATMKNAAKCDT